MSKENKVPKTDAVKNLREIYNKRRDDTLKKAKENAKKLPRPKGDEQAANPTRPKHKDLDL